MKATDFLMLGVVAAVGVGATVYIMRKTAPKAAPDNSTKPPAAVTKVPLKVSFETDDAASALQNIGGVASSLRGIIDDGTKLFSSVGGLFN